MATPDEPNTEARILRAMRLTLTNVIKDTTTQPGLKHPLSDGTIEDIRQCLKLISARERELDEAAGTPPQRPHYIDEPKTSTVVPIGRIGRAKKGEPEGE
jgi:hypothetical protein